MLCLYIISTKAVAQRYKLITPPLYECNQNSSGVFACFKNGKNIVLDTTGKEIHFKGAYNERIIIVSGNRFVVEVGEPSKYKQYLIDDKERRLSENFDGFQGFNKERLSQVWINKKRGIINTNGKVIIPVRYDRIPDALGADGTYFTNGLMAVEIDGDKQLLDREGKVFKSLGKGFDHIHLSDFDETYYCKDTLGRFFSFDTQFNCINKPLIYTKNKKSGIVASCTQKEIVPCQFDYVTDLGSSRYELIKGEEISMIDKNGNTVVASGKFKYYGSFRRGLASVSDKSGKMGYIDSLGKLIIPCIFDKASMFSQKHGIAVASKNGKFGLINMLGNNVTDFEYDAIAESDLRQDLIRVGKDEKWGYIDPSGKLIVPLKYTRVDEFEKGFAIIGIENKHGMIDKSGKEIVPLQYDWARKCQSSKGRALMAKNNKVALVDNKGAFIVPLLFSDIDEFLGRGLYSEDYYIYKQNNKNGLLKCL